jgi:uncharacterized protein YjiS (DUF1127 family)
MTKPNQTRHARSLPRRLLRSLLKSWQFQAERRRLESLPDRTLSDIGISRSDIPRILRDSMF